MRIERKQVVIGAIIAGMLAAFAYLLYTPMQNSIHGIKAARSAKAILERSAKTELAQLPGFKVQLAAMQVRVGNYNARMPRDRELGPFLQQMADVMSKHGLKDQLVEPQEEVKIGSLVCIPVEIQCSGTMREIFEFFKSLKDLERTIRIEQVELKNAKDTDGLLTMAARTNIYYEPANGNQ